MRRTLTLLSMLWMPFAHATLNPQIEDLDTLPLHAVAPAATAKAIAAMAERKGAGPAIFAVTVELPVSLDGGVWDEVESGLARWRTRVYSAGAGALLMEFGHFYVPDSAKLWIYDAAGEVVQGPYGSAEHNVNRHLWTAIVPGESAVIELRVPQSDRATVELSLARLGHAFKNTRDLGDSGACNINTACPLGNEWRNEIRSAVKLQIPVLGGVGVCSGTLINNLAQNDKPFVLTADHCGIGRTNSPATGVRVYWNFQNSSCGSENATDTQTQLGVILRANDEPTDLSLLELSQTPDAAFDVYYAGWDASGTGGNSGVSIHHPSGDAKKISEFIAALVQASVNIGGSDIPSWRVNWSQGTTEQGSSGSGLWNQNRQIVGVLSGGAASCQNQNGADFYARLDRQWLARSQSSGQLKAWLDPNNTGQRKIAGKNPGTATTPTPTPTVTPTPQPTASPMPTPTPTSTPIPTSTPTPTPSGESGGGGGIGLSLLGMLLGFGLLRRRRV